MRSYYYEDQRCALCSHAQIPVIYLYELHYHMVWNIVLLLWLTVGRYPSRPLIFSKPVSLARHPSINTEPTILFGKDMA